MRFFRHIGALSLLSVVITAGCAVETGDPDVSALETPALDLQAYCSITCGDGTSRSCPNGTNMCSASGSGCGAYIVCDGVRSDCPPCAAGTCTYGGKVYQNKQMVTGATCNFIYGNSGICTGPCAARECITNANCKAMCDSGTWDCTY